MAATQKHCLFLFGDQTDDCTPTIRQLYADSRHSALLAEYLRKCSDVLQIECANLDLAVRHEVPHFESVLEMAEEQAKTDGSPVFMSSFLSYVARTGELIVRAERDPDILQSDRTVVGLCISLFPALLSAFARTAGELSNLAVEAFPTYIEMIKKNHFRTKSVEWAHGYWSYLAMRPADLNVQPFLDAFHEQYKIPPHRHAWIGVESRSWSTISAPPSTLQMLLEKSPEIKALPGMTLPVAGAVHAPHLPAFSYEDVRRDTPIWSLIKDERATIMGTNECVPYKAENLGDYVRVMMGDVTCAQLRPDKTFNAAADLLKDCGKPVEFTVAAPSAQTGAFLKALKTHKVNFKVAERPSLVEAGAPKRGGTGAIAICGMAGRFPGSNDMEKFWETMMEGQTFMKKVPKDRFDLDEFYDKTGKKKNSMVTTDGCFIDEPGVFDPKLFKMSPREVLQMDPTHRLLLMVTMEALEKAGHNPENTPAETSKRTSVWFGQNADVWREIDGQMGLDVFTAPGILRAFSPGRINYFFGFEGGSYSLDAACSSSSTTIQLACNALERRECDMAVAGGAQIASNPFEFAALGKSGFLSKGGGCKTFRAEADGYCRGEAVGVVTLKRLEDAIADNDNIEAVITGWGRNYSAGAQSITHPHAASQKKLYGQVLRQANRTPADIGYVELHGTGTIAGDLSEMKLVTSTFNGHFSPEKPLHVGALKANFGHSEAAAGVSSTIKAAMMAKRGICPPQACITPTTKYHPGFKDLDMSTVKIDYEPATLNSTNIMVNNFDAAGGNTCLLVEAPPALPAKKADPRSHHVVTVSARTNPSLHGNKEDLLEYLLKNPDTKLADVAYSSSARRMQHALKASFVASTTEELISQLQKDIAKSKQDAKVLNGADLVWMFTGQGSHYAGMGAELYKTNARFNEKLNIFQAQCDSFGFPRFLEMITDANADMSSFNTIQVQLAIVALELALADLWTAWGLKPKMVIGHSLGEYIALCVSGVLSPSDTLYLVGTRATMLLNAAKPDEYGMLSLAATVSEVEKLLKETGYDKTCEHACYNSPKSNVVSGPVAELKELETKAKASGMRAKVLPVPYAFHSAQLDSIYEEFQAVAAGVPFTAPVLPIASTLTGKLVDKEGVFTPEYLAKHARQPVRFVEALQSIKATKTKNQNFMWLEIGPGPINSAFLRETLDVPATDLLTSMKSGEPNYKSISASLSRCYNAGVHVKWPEYHRPHQESVSLVDLPTYHFDTKVFWKTYTTATAAVAGVDMGNTQAAAPAAPPMIGKFQPTASVQEIVKEEITDDKISVTFTSDLANESLRGVIKGHNIEGYAICPAGAYVDMAAAASKYVFAHALPDKKSMGTFKNLELSNPLVLKDEKTKQTLEVRVTAEKKEDWTCHITFFSKTENGKFDENGKVDVASADPAEQNKAWAKDGETAKKRMESLMKLEPGKKTPDSFVHRMNPRVFYQLFNNVVHYDKRYQAGQEAFVDYENGDALVKVKLSKTPAADTWAFTFNPYHGDSLVHLAGFQLNTGHEDSDEILYFSSGMSSVMISAEMADDKTYYAYSKITSGHGESEATIFVFDEAKALVGVVSGLKFHQMKRQVLKMSLQLSQGSSSAPAPKAGAKKAGAKAGAKAPAPKKVSMADAFLDALMSETGVDAGDLDDATLLTELGVDSLMGMAVLQKVQQVTGTALPATIFFELQTVGDVKEHLGGSTEGEAEAEPAAAAAEEEEEEEEEVVETSGGSSGATGGGMAQVFLEALMSETGVEAADLDDATLLTELGVDSLMGMAVLQKVQQVTGETLPATIFFELQTIGDVKEHLGVDGGADEEDTPGDSPMDTPGDDNTSVSSTEDPDKEPVDPKDLPKKYKSNAVLLQGDTKSGQKPLFYVAGSSGSASIYAKVPKMECNIPVYALETPFLQCPMENKYTPEEIAPVYLDAIKKIQPQGPYLIGGYSAGAVFAYEISRLLLNSGEEVEHLLMADMKAHRPGETWTEAPQMDDMDAAGSSIRAVDKQFGVNRAIQLAREQRYASLACMYNWKPTPMEKFPTNGCSMVWAKNGMCERFKIPGMEADPEINPMSAESRDYKKWFYSRRHTYDANGWDVLCGPVDCKVMDGDHWNMLEPPQVAQLTKHMNDIITSLPGRS